MHIEPGDRTPEVQMNSQTGEILFTGESYPENAINFYKPILDKLEELCQNKTPLVLRFELIYINSSSLGMLRNLLSTVHHYAQQGLPVSVNWQAYEDDDSMREMGEDLQELFPALSFQLQILKD
jgi:hypothetical protein